MVFLWILYTGDNQAFAFTPDNGYHIATVLVDGNNNLDAVANGYYTFANVTASHTIHVTFAKNAYTITASSGEHGIIDPNGIITVDYGDDQQFFFEPEEPCYEIDKVWIDGILDPQAATNDSYTFENVAGNHTIAVSFKIITLTIEATAGANGSIIPVGETPILCGADKTFIFIPAEGYHIESVSVDGEDNPDAVANGFYTFENVTANNHTIEVTFAINEYTIHQSDIGRSDT